MPKRSLWVEGRDDGAGIVAGEVRRGRTELEAGALEEAARRREARREVVGLDPVALRDADAGLHRDARGTPVDQGAKERRGVLRPTADHACIGAPLLDGGANPGDQAAAADRGENRVDLRALLDDLDADGALTGDHVGIVVGGDVRSAGLTGSPPCLQFDRQRIGVDDNFWLVEGIACYLESFEVAPNGNIRVGDPRHVRIENARQRLLQLNFFIPLRTYVALGMSEFQSPPDADTLRGYYSQAAGLTHFFMHYEEGLYRDALIEHLAQIYSPNVRVRGNPASLAELTGVSIDELDRQYHSYLTEMQDTLDAAAK